MKPGGAGHGALSQGGHTGHTYSPSNEVCHLPGKPIRDSAPWVFTGGRSHRHPLPGTYQTSRLRTGRLAVSINHCLYTQSRRSEPRLSVRESVGGPPEIQVPRRQPLASLANRPLRRTASGLLCYHISTHGWTPSRLSGFSGSSSPLSQEHGLCPVPLGHWAARPAYHGR